MERHETHGISRGQNVLDTIAFGSMLVFASVMPPLGPDSAGADARSPRQGDGIAGGSDPAGGVPSAGPAPRSQRCYKSC